MADCKRLKWLEAGEPVTVPRYFIGGNDFPEAREWAVYRDRSIRGLRCGRADDVVVPVYGRV